MKPDEVLAAILRAAGILSILNSPPAVLSGEVGPIILAGYQVVIGIIFLVFADSIARFCYRLEMAMEGD